VSLGNFGGLTTALPFKSTPIPLPKPPFPIPEPGPFPSPSPLSFPLPSPPVPFLKGLPFGEPFSPAVSSFPIPPEFLPVFFLNFSANF